MSAAWPDVPGWDPAPEPDPSEQSWNGLGHDDDPPESPWSTRPTPLWQQPAAAVMDTRDVLAAAAAGDTAALWEAATRDLLHHTDTKD